MLPPAYSVQYRALYWCFYNVATGPIQTSPQMSTCEAHAVYEDMDHIVLILIAVAWAVIGSA